MKLTASKFVLGVAAVLGLLCGPTTYAADKASDNDAVLTTLGALSGSFLYQTHQNIGMLADAQAKKVYDTKTSKQILQVTINLINVVNEHLDDLLDEDLGDDDLQAVQEFEKINEMLKKQAEALASFWNTGDEEDAENYLKLRDKSWKRISKMLGIEGKE